MISVGDFYGSNLYEGYHAKVFVDDEVPVVEFWRHGEFIAVRSFPNHTLGYAEDAAENFVMGVLKL